MGVARMGDMRNAYKILVWKREEKRPLGRPKRRYVVKVKVKSFLCLTKYHAMKTYWEEWRYSSTHS
jgi:hypothetical protein